MIILFLLTSFLELTIFLFAAITFVLAVRFFMSSRRRLLEEFPGIPGQRKLTGFGFDRSGFLIPKNQDKPTGTFPHYHAPASDTRKPAPAKDEIRDLRRQLQQQQQELSKAMEKISGISQSRGISEPTGNVGWEDEQKSETLRRQMEKKEAEINRLRGQESYTQQLQERFEEVQGEFEKLQEKMAGMEKQAWQTAELNLQLEQAEQEQLQFEKTLHKKEEKLRELSLENHQLHNTLHDLENKLKAADLQRQQLQKKIQLLEDINSNMMDMDKENRSLRSESVRMAELESMLHMMTDEIHKLRRK
jgi:chromosome segregation ATPase